jgi:hypothetical protein
MSIDLSVFVPSVSKELIPKLLNRLSELGMDCELHPEFAFDQENDGGFLPIRMTVKASKQPHYPASDILTGFELDIADFDYSKELADRQASMEQSTPAPGMIARLFGHKNPQPAPTAVLHSPEIDALLKNCHKQIELHFHSDPTSEFRCAAYFAGVLAEITGGIYFDPQSDSYYKPGDAVKQVIVEVDEFESSVPSEDWHLEPFESWID